MPRLDLAFERGLQLSQATDFSFTDDATPLGVDDTTGSTGAMTVAFDRQENRAALVKQLKGQAVVMSTAGTEARAIGRVGHVSGSETACSIDIDSVAIRLAVKRNLPPFIGRLDAAVRAWAAKCGVGAEKVVVDPAIAAQQVRLVGFSDNVWLRIKQLTAAVGIEVVVVDDTIVIRPPRAAVVDAARQVSRSWEIDDTNVAQSITVNYYDPRNIVAGDLTIDYSRSNVTGIEDPDDTGAGVYRANAPLNVLPPGWAKISTVSDT